MVDTYSGFVARIAKGGRSYPVCASKLSVYPINRATAASVARDKTFEHYVLAGGGYAAPPGDYFFLQPPRAGWSRPPGRERADGVAFAARLSDGYAQPLIVKPNAGTGARLVHFVTGEAELHAALDAVAREDEIALVQSFVDRPEFRLFLVDGEIMFGYRKTRASIAGDGRRSVCELCAALGSHKQAGAILDSPFLAWRLARRGLTRQSVLPAGERLQIDAVSNISAGGQFTGFVALSDVLRDWARGLARTVGPAGDGDRRVLGVGAGRSARHRRDRCQRLAPISARCTTWATGRLCWMSGGRSCARRSMSPGRKSSSRRCP